MEIVLPFRDDMAKAVKDRKKFCTSRTKKKGEPGDTFWLDDSEYEIIVVKILPLAYVASFLYRLEGFGDPVEFIAIWNEIHPKRHFQGTDGVYVHFFIPKVIV